MNESEKKLADQSTVAEKLGQTSLSKRMAIETEREPDCFEETAVWRDNVAPVAEFVQGKVYPSSIGKGVVCAFSCCIALGNGLERLVIFQTIDDAENALAARCEWCANHNFDITMDDMEPVEGCWRHYGNEGVIT